MKIKAVLSVLVACSSSVAVSAFAAGSSANFNVSLKSNLQGLARNSCFNQIHQVSKAQGNGDVRVLVSADGLIVVSANLSEAGAREVQSLPCVQSIELDSAVGSN